MFLFRMKKPLILYISVAFVLFSGCSGYEKVVKGTDYELKYTTAIGLYNKGDFYKAQVLLDQIAPIFRGTAKADSVYFFQAMSYFEQGDFIMAGHYFETFAKTYGASPFVEESDYMTAFCYYKISPRPELDQSYTVQSIQAFQKFVIKHPRSSKRQQALDYISELREKLVEKSFISARLYYDLEDYKASLVALSNGLLEYPDSKYREDMMFMVVKSSFKYAENSVFTRKRERFQDALDNYYSFKAEYPESKYIREANRYQTATLKYLGDDFEVIN